MVTCSLIFLLLLVGLAPALGGCARQPEGQGGAAEQPGDSAPPLPTGRTLVYTCDVPGGEALTFAVRPGSGEVGITLPERFENRTLVLPQVSAPSGSKFEGEGVLFWISGEHIRLDIDGQTFGPCAERPPPSAGAVAQDSRDVAFRAVGQEPGWILEITPERHMRFTYAYGEQEVYTPVPKPEETSGRTVYHAVTEAHDLRVMIENQVCTDVMSGEAYKAMVTVTLDGQTYHGCGRAIR